MFQRRFWRLRCPAGIKWQQDVLASEKEWGESLAAEWDKEWRAFVAARRAAAAAAERKVRAFATCCLPVGVWVVHGIGGNQYD